MSDPSSHSLAASPWLRRTLVGLLLGLLLLLGFEVLQPFLVSFVWAVILCFVTWQPYLRVTRLLRGSRTWAALLMTLLLTAAVILPTILLIWAMRAETAEAYQLFSDWLARGPRLPPASFRLPFVGHTLENYDARLLADPTTLRTTLQALFNNSSKQLTDLLGDVGRNLVKLLLTVVSAFFVYRDGDAFLAQVRVVLEQLFGRRVHGYVDAAGATVKAVLVSLVVCALAQGVLAGLGYWVAGVGAPVFGAAATALAAMIPFAVPLVWGSICAWLFVSGHHGAALALLVWCVLVVSWVDNLIRPMVISSATRIPFLLVMFGVLGGLGAFGLVGLFVGPAVLAVLAALWNEWQHDRRGEQDPEKG